jgi:dTDP-4-dehydrorhamnose 3,5-epimerase
MKIIETAIKDVFIIKPDIFFDDRGYFFESYNAEKYAKMGIKDFFMQDNQSCSKKNVIRGLHYQVGENAQGKLIRVLSGKILDIAVDIRFNSPTFGKYASVELSAENRYQLWIPPGFAHGFSVLSENTVISYKCTKLYCKSDERGIIFNDKDLAINWEIDNPIVSQKDKEHIRFKEIARDFIYE